MELQGNDIPIRLGRRRILPDSSSVALRFMLPVVGFAAFVGIWWFYSTRNPLTVPPPRAVALDLWHNFIGSTYLADHGVAGGKGYWYDLLYTTKNVLIGVGLGTALGVGLGLLSVPAPILGEIINPIAATFGSAPIFVAAPFFLIWFGIVPIAQVLMVTLYTALLMYIFSRRASDNVSAELVESAATLGAQRRTIFWLVFVPATVPELIGAFRIALAGAWGLEAVAELLGAQQGIGFLIDFFVQAYLLTGIVAITLMLGVVAIVFDGIAMVGARFLVRWNDTRQIA
jgi:ABC-type nitrate/sulfonate/bicarbonate transport system permease component